MKPEQDKDGKSPKEKYGPTENTEVTDGKPPPAKGGRLLERLLRSEQWGNLPRKLREEILNSTGKEFPLEYQEIIFKYFEKMAELQSKE